MIQDLTGGNSPSVTSFLPWQVPGEADEKFAGCFLRSCVLMEGYLETLRSHLLFTL